MRIALSPSMAVSITALVVALGGAGYSATGGNFILGQSNSATTRSTLTASITDRALQITNSSTGAQATALGLSVGSGRPPMVVNSNTKVRNLNADLLDGLDSTDFAIVLSEGWNYVGDPGKPGFENAWTNFNGPGQPHNQVTNQHAAYRKDGSGVVHLGGVVSGGTITLPIFTLPTTHCPFFTKIFPAISNNAFSRITVNRVASGCAVFANFGSNAWVSLEGVAFLESDLEQRIEPVIAADENAGPASSRKR
jgi:hypothetical protein